jgi:hypothetical protein
VADIPKPSREPGWTNRSRVANLFSAMDRTIKGNRLYLGRGEMAERLFAKLKSAAKEATEEGPLTVTIASSGVVFDGKPVGNPDTRVPYLFRLYLDGVRELTILQNADPQELLGLAEVLGTDPRGSEEDLVTLLWARNFRTIRHYAVDAIATGAEAEMADGRLAQARSGQALDARQQIGDVKLALSASDLRVLHTGGALEWVAAARGPVAGGEKVKALSQRVSGAIDGRPDFARFMAIARRVGGEHDGASPLVVDMYDSLLNAGDVEGVAAMVLCLGDSPVDRAAIMEPSRMEKLAPLYAQNPDALRDALVPLVRAEPDGMVALLTALPPGPTAEGLREVLLDAGVDLTRFYANRIQDPDDSVANDALAALGRIATGPALETLSKALSSNLSTRRRVALNAMGGNYHESARIGLGRALNDPDKENRMLAMGILGGSGDPRVAYALLSAVQNVHFNRWDRDEQESLYDAVAALKDIRTLDHFRKVMNRKTMGLNKGGSRHQLLGAKALGTMDGMPEALELLRDCRDKWYHPAEVRAGIETAIEKLLRGDR